MSNGFNPPRWLTTSVVGLLLLLHFGLAVSSVRYKSNTFDEIIHLTAGYTYWKFNDYRFQPENGNLPQRWVTLPLLLQSQAFPEIVHNVWDAGHEFFFKLGNDPEAMLHWGRIMVVLLSMALGFVVFLISRNLFGPLGGIISLILYAFSPTMLAHGRLTTSDMAAALFFIASIQSLWSMMHHMTWFSMAGASAAVCCLLLSKMSGVLIVPIFIVLCAIRLIRGDPLTIKFRRSKQVLGRKKQTVWFLFATATITAVCLMGIWGAYGFRFVAASDFPPYSGFSFSSWDEKLAKTGMPGAGIRFMRDRQMLPEAYLYGFAHVLSYGQKRGAFMNGRYSDHGWWYFFPFCLAVKTPLISMLILLLSIFALLTVRKSGDLYNMSPQLTLAAIYFVVAVSASLNIGHRHILVFYPVMFILAGGVARQYGRFKRVFLCLSPVFLFVLILETQVLWPDYLAFFNAAAGGPRNGYRLLVDSSLDWGQDLPWLKKWLEKKRLFTNGKWPVYLAYFGTASPIHYEIPATIIPLRPLPWLKDVEQRTGPLQPGYYCVSATELQQVYGIHGKWTRSYEIAYWDSRESAEKYLRHAKTSPGNGVRGGNAEKTLARFERLRFARLCGYLKKREPDAHVGHSILIYFVSPTELNQALLGPPPGKVD